MHFGRQCKKKLRKLRHKNSKGAEEKDEKQQRSWKAQKWGVARRICILLLVMYLNRKQIRELGSGNGIRKRKILSASIRFHPPLFVRIVERQRLSTAMSRGCTDSEQNPKKKKKKKSERGSKEKEP